MKCLIVLLLLISVAKSYKILGVFAHPGSSHFFVIKPLLEALAKKNHEVTVLSFLPSEKKICNYKDIALKLPGKQFDNTLSLNSFSHSWYEKYLTPTVLYYFASLSCNAGLSSKQYQDLLNSNETYDLIISEFFNTNCLLLPLVDKLKVPFIGITTHHLLPWTNEWVGNPDHPAYIAQCVLNSSDKKSFLERFESTLFDLYIKYYYRFVIEQMENDLFQKYLKKDVPFSENLIYNASLIIVSTHFTINRPRPLVPGVVEVGGIHLDGKLQKLPVHIEKWINESTHGVIYFSFGSMIKGHSFPEEKRQMFIRAFSRFPQRILWKWEADTMPGKPENIMIEKWMPQFDILCHPNVKAFIAHGGLLGVTEAVHCGVPLIIMPQFGDQFTNAKAIEASGGGVILDYRSMDEESIYNALKNVLDPSFNKKAKELSARFRDRPMPPLETAIYWVEYVARHGGAPHLRTAAVGMPLYQYLLLDVIAFLAVILFLVMYIFYVVTRAIFRKIFKVKEKVKKN